MNKHKFSTLERLALWGAYNKRCAYSGEPLSYSDLHIDHILPESLLHRPEDLETLRSEYGLDGSFAINSYLNWLPVHVRFNLQKGALVFDQPKAMYFLGISKARYPQILALEAQYRRLMAKERLLLPVGAAIDAGLLSLDEAIGYLRTCSQGATFDLLQEVSFRERSLADIISPEEAASLASLTVAHGDPHEEGIILVNDAGAEVRVRTCDEFAAAKQDGFYALTTYTMGMESFFNKTCGIVRALSRARTPNVSYIDRPRVGILDLSLLPATQLGTTMTGEFPEPVLEAIAERRSVQDLVDVGHVVIRRVSQYSVHLEHHMGQVMWELFRADFDGDGIEDILVYDYGYAIGGTFGYGNVSVLTRLGPDDQLSKVKVWSDGDW